MAGPEGEEVNDLLRNDMSFARIEMMRRAGSVERMHCVRPLVQDGYNIAEHTYNAMCIAMELCRINLVQPGRVLAKLLYHDAPEVETGDMPANIKRASPEAETAMRILEGGFKKKWDIEDPEAVTFRLQKIPGNEAHQLELGIYKASDYLELGWFCLVERRMGNRYVHGGQSVDTVFKNIMEYILAYSWIPGVVSISEYLNKEWRS